MPEDISGKMGLDTTDWKTGVAQVNRDVRAIESGFRAVAAGMDDWSKSAKGLKERNKTLADVIDQQKNKVSLLEAGYERMKKEAEKSGDTTVHTANALQEFTIKINRAKEQLAKNETELRKNSKALKELKKNVGDSAKKVKDLSDKETIATKATKKLKEAAENASNSIKNGLTVTATAAGAAVVAMGAAATATVKSLFDLGTESDKALGTIGAKTGATGAELEELGEIAQKVYTNNFGENLEDVADGLSTVKQNTGLVGDELQKATENGFALRDTFDMDLAESSRTVAALMKNMNISAEEAYNIIATGAQSGANKNGDLLDTLNEYANQYDKLGLSADQMLQSLITGADSGAFSIDKVGDAVKEFSIRSVDMSKTSADAYKALGLNSDKMFAAFAEGGDTANAAFFEVISALQNIDDPLKQSQLGVALFGTQFEDLGAGVLPILASMEGGITDTSAAMDQINAVKYDNAEDAAEGLKRTIQGNLLPISKEVSGAFTSFAQDATTALQDGFQADDIAVIFDSFRQNLKSIIGLAKEYLPLISEMVGSLISEIVTILPEMIELLLPAAFSLLQSLVDAIVQNIDPLITLAVSLITMLSQFLIENLPTLYTAAIQIINGLVDGLITLLPELIPAAIDMMVQIALALVEAIPEITARLPEIINAIIEGLKAVDWMQTGIDIITAVINGLFSVGETLWTTASDLGGRIWDAITSTDWLSLGQNLINGVVEGMSGLVTSVTEKVTGFFSNIWGGVKNFFGIHSPSTVAAEDGKNLMEGFQTGAEDAQPSVLDKVKGVFSGIWDGIKSIFGFGGGGGNESAEAKQTGKDVTTAVAEGISGGGEEAQAAVKTTSATIIDLFRTELGVSEGTSTATKPFGIAAVQGLIDGFAETMQAAKTKATEIATEILASLTGALIIIGNTSTLTMGYGKSTVQGIIDGLNEMLPDVKTEAQNVGSAISDGITAGIQGGAGAIATAARSAASAALKAAKKLLGIASPSKVAAKELGLPFVQGIAQGMAANIGVLASGVKGVTSGLVETAKSITPITLPKNPNTGGGTTIVSAVLQLGEKPFGELVVELADAGQGFAASNQQRIDMGVQLT